MKQPAWAPPVFGGAMLAGVAAAVISGYEITDCLRFQSRQGQCSDIIQSNALPLVAGLAAVLGPLGGYFTLNASLESPIGIGRQRLEELQEEAGSMPDWVLPNLPDTEPSGGYEAEAVKQLRADGLTQQAAETVKQLQADGLTQQAIADQLGLTRSAVQWLLET